MRILFFLLFPIFLSAQINRAYGVIEIGATFPTSSATGPKFAYRTVDSSFYRWVSGSTWVKIIPDEGGLTMPFDSITFNPTTVDPDTAELKYSQDLETFVFGADGTIIEIGQKTAWYVKNQTGSTINKGTVVRTSGTLGSSGRILISPMVIDGTVSSKYLLGITASNIGNGSDGYVIHFGKLRKFNTSAWADGTVLYAGTGGTLTSTEPSPPNLRLPIAFVVHSHAVNGVLAIRIQTGNELHELHDVDTTGIQNNGLLTWNSSSQKWQAAAPDNDKSSSNEIQTLSFASPLLAISSGNNVDLSPILTGYVTGSGTSNLLPKWSAITNLTNSNISDNNTVVSILNSKPFRLGQWTTAGRPSGVNGYEGFNTSFNWPEWYSSTGWFSPARAATTGGAFTAGYIPFGGTGGLTESIGLRFTDNSALSVRGSIQINHSGTQVIEYTSNKIAINQFSSTGTNSISLFGRAQGTDGISIGNGSSSTGTGSLAFGAGSKSTASYGLAYGLNTIAQGTPSFAVGVGSVASTNEVVIGYPYDGGFSQIYFGSGKDRSVNSGGTPVQIAGAGTDVTINGSGANGTNQNGGSLTIAGGKGTGSGTASDVIFSTATAGASGTTLQSLTQRWFIKGTTGYLSNSSTANYLLDLTSSTNALGLARGTVAQRPTIISSTTPIRYNTDSTAIEYGESVGTWRLLATRAYARSLVAALPTTNIYTADGSLTANRTLTGGAFDLRLQTDVTVGDSLKVATLPNHTAPDSIVTTKGGWLGKKRFFMDGANSYLNGYNGFFDEGWYRGFQSGSATKYNVFYQDSTGYTNMYAQKGDNFTEFFSGDIDSNPSMYFQSRAGNYGMGVQAKTDFVRFFLDGGSNIRGNASVLYMDSLGTLLLTRYGTGTKKTAALLSKTQSNYIAGFATDGTVLDLERKRDTTIYIVDADLDWSAAITTAQISRRYNRVIFLMTTTAAAGSNSDLTLHTPDVNLMQVEYLIRSTDETGGFTNTIQFGSNNAVASDNALASSYTPSAGQGMGIRAGLRSGVYKYYYY